MVFTVGGSCLSRWAQGSDATMRMNKNILFALLVAQTACKRPPPDSNPPHPPQVAQSLLSTNLVAHWPFDEDTGPSAADVTPLAQTATAQGPATWAVPGRIGKAIALTTGVHLRVESSTTLNAITTAISVAGWIKRVSHPASGDQYLLFRRSTALPSVVHVLQSPSGAVCFSIAGTQICDGPASEDTWHHVAATWNGSQSRLYVDGVLRATGSPPVSH